MFLRIPNEEELTRFQIARRSAFDAELPRLTAEYEREVERRERRLSNGRGGSEPQPIAPSLENFSFVWDEIQNLQRVDFGEHYSIVDGERIFIIEVIPGDYILYGLTYGSYSEIGSLFLFRECGISIALWSDH